MIPRIAQRIRQRIARENNATLVVYGLGGVIALAGLWFAVFGANNSLPAGVLLGIVLFVLGIALVVQARIGGRWVTPPATQTPAAPVTDAAVVDVTDPVPAHHDAD